MKNWIWIAILACCFICAVAEAQTTYEVTSLSSLGGASAGTSINNRQ